MLKIDEKFHIIDTLKLKTRTDQLKNSTLRIYN